MTIRHAAAIVFATALLAGCASGASGAVNDAAGSAPGQQAAGAAYAPLRSSSGSTTAAGSSLAQSTAIVIGTPPSSDIERSVNATYTVPPHQFLDSFDGVIARAVGAGGYVVSSSTQPDSTGRIVSGAVTLKVPAAKIADFLNGMPSTFVASAINFSSIDHTAQFVDVNARLASARARLAAVVALLSRATSIADISTLEQEIENVQIEVNTYQGQLNVLNASVTMATATVQLAERGTNVAPVTPPNPVSSGVGSGWSNAVQVTGAALEGVVSALPLLAVLAAALVLWRVRGAAVPRRRRSGVAE